MGQREDVGERPKRNIKGRCDKARRMAEMRSQSFRRLPMQDATQSQESLLRRHLEREWRKRERSGEGMGEEGGREIRNKDQESGGEGGSVWRDSKKIHRGSFSSFLGLSPCSATPLSLFHISLSLSLSSSYLSAASLFVSVPVSAFCFCSF